MPIITDRDRAILWSLGTTRVLSAQEIEWLHFPGWEERERLHKDQTPNEAVRRPAGVHRRIRVLQKAGLLRWMIRPMTTSDRNTKKLPLLHSLTQRGKNYLQDVLEDDADTLWDFPETQQPNLENMDHSYLIGRTYAALAAGSVRDGHALTDWLGDHLLVKDYDRLAVAGYREKLPMLPDASGVLVTEALHRRFFVEVDRGTMAIARWREKIAAQHTYRNSQELHLRYATTTFFTCIVAPSARRLLRIAEAVARVTREPGYVFLFTTLDQLHPTTIRACWKRISAIRWETRRAGDGTVEHPTITFAPVGLWKPLSSSPQPPPQPPVHGVAT